MNSVPKTQPEGWRRLVSTCSFRGEGKYPLPAYSEFMPPIRLGCRPYGGAPDKFFLEDEPAVFPVTEMEEFFEIRPGLGNIARQAHAALLHLVRGEAAEGISQKKLAANPYWPPDLAERAGRLKHERWVSILPLALSRTQDDKGRRRWTFFGGSEQGPSRAFWKSFFSSPGRQVPEQKCLSFIRALLKGAYGETLEDIAGLYRAGFRIWSPDGRPDRDLLPDWTSTFLFGAQSPSREAKYLLCFEPFAALPELVKQAYFSGDLHLLPFPGSLLFWGVQGYLKMRSQWPMATQIPLLHVVQRHEAPHGLRVPQSGWIHERHPDHPLPHEDFGPYRTTFRRTHRWARVQRHEDELALGGRDEHILHVLFSTAPDDLGLYGKPMARNSQIWTGDYRLLLDGPAAGKKEIQAAFEVIKEGGLFGYRFQYPPMQVGDYQIFWHRPLIFYGSPDADHPSLLDDAPLGYLTACRAGDTDLDHPIEFRPRLLDRPEYQEAIELLGGDHKEHKILTQALDLLDAPNLLGRKIPRSFARSVLLLPREKTLESWLDLIPGTAPEKGRRFAGRLRDLISRKEEASVPRGKKVPASFTFSRTATRAFEIRFWKDIALLSGGHYANQANSDCIMDTETQKRLRHHHRDLDALGDFLLAYYRRTAAGRGMGRTVLVGDLPFQWDTDFNFEWWGGWVRDQEKRTEERNLCVVIPGRDRRRAVIMADHYDTAYMEDIYYRDKGGCGARLSAPGADDNHSATAALMEAALVFLDLSREGKLGCDIWLVHLTGEEFPSDCLGARHLCRKLVEGNLRLRLSGGRERDLSQVRVQGVFVLDMIAHNGEDERDTFQISPGRGADAARLADHAHSASEIWNASLPLWNRRPSRRGKGRGKRSRDRNIIPEIALHPCLDGQIRLPRNPRSTLYNTDAQIFSDAGIPVVLFMENYDISRQGYHDSQDTMANIDLDYGAAVAAIAIEAVARAAAG